MQAIQRDTTTEILVCPRPEAVVLPVAAAAHANPLGELGSEFLLLFQSTPIFL